MKDHPAHYLSITVLSSLINVYSDVSALNANVALASVVKTPIAFLLRMQRPGRQLKVFGVRKSLWALYLFVIFPKDLTFFQTFFQNLVKKFTHMKTSA